MFPKTKKSKSGVMKIFPQKLVDVNYWYMDKVRHDCFIIYIQSENPRIFLIQVYKEDFSYEFTTTCYKHVCDTINSYTRVLYAICI